jgi:hypothetical protein
MTSLRIDDALRADSKVISSLKRSEVISSFQ